MKDGPGPRHALIVAKTIKATGMLDENQVVIGTVGRFNFRGILKIVPLGLRMGIKGKVPPLIVHPVDRVDEVRTIFNAMEVPVA